MSDLPKAYNAADHEEVIYQRWRASGFFNPDNLPKATGKPFTIVMPPPNVTGILHAGHALFVTLQDIFIRFARMQGRRALWVPGTDHAAIATQAKVEKILYSSEEKTRYDLGREAFLARVRQYAEESQVTILHQIEKLGASCDWTRLAYTMDSQRSQAVFTAFERLFAMGLIYRGKRIVNWDPKMQTTVSDDELAWKEETIPLYYLRYGPFEIVTARPETKFGDKYVVMHPDDTRYAAWRHGQQIELEWINGPVTATILKDAVIDREFGTGVMTITPWHDATDFELAEKHKLDFEQIIDEQGKLLPIAGELAGLHIKKARPLIVEKLQQKGLVSRIEADYTHRIATNSRGGGIIEPQIKEQWFVAVNKPFVLLHSKLKSAAAGTQITLKQLMRRVVEHKEITLIPDRFSKTYFHWIDNLRDWCISRQIWFGHRVPVWTCADCHHVQVTVPSTAELVVVRHGQAEHNLAKICNGDPRVPVHLTPEGRTQIQAVAGELAGTSFDTVYVSEFARAQESVEILAHGQKIMIDARLNDARMGIYEGKDCHPMLEKLRTDHRQPLEGGESLHDVTERIGRFLQEIVQKHPTGRVLVMTSEVPNWAIDHLLGEQPLQEVTSRRFPPATVTRYALENFQVCQKCGSWRTVRDSDTLDTWFSSGLWTFSTLGWPAFAKTATAGKPGPEHDLANYHPTQVLETAYEILFFWVARMILMTTALLGQIPFEHVYLHGLVRDAKREKLSKSKGDSANPLDLIERFGADALRFGLVFNTAPGMDSVLSEEKIRGMRNFANKVWNIGRFVMMNQPEEVSSIKYQVSSITEADREILKKLNTTMTNVTRAIEGYRPHEAAETIYQFIWHDLADTYLEAAKGQMGSEQEGVNSKQKDQIKQTQHILLHVYTQSLKLLHPFMPFVTEAMWQYLPIASRDTELLMVAAWPKTKK